MEQRVHRGKHRDWRVHHRRRRNRQRRRRLVAGQAVTRRRRPTNQPGTRWAPGVGEVVIKMTERRWLVAILAALIPIAGGCNTIFGVDKHSLAPDGGAGGSAGTGGSAG